jgi:hypothetical protein
MDHGGNGGNKMFGQLIFFGLLLIGAVLVYPKIKEFHQEFLSYSNNKKVKMKPLSTTTKKVFAVVVFFFIFFIVLSWVLPNTNPVKNPSNVTSSMVERELSDVISLIVPLIVITVFSTAVISLSNVIGRGGKNRKR